MGLLQWCNALRSGHCHWAKNVSLAQSQVHMESSRHPAIAWYLSYGKLSWGTQRLQLLRGCETWTEYCSLTHTAVGDAIFLSKLFLCWVIVLPSISHFLGYCKAACAELNAVKEILLCFSIFPCQVMSPGFVFSPPSSLGSLLTLH